MHVQDKEGGPLELHQGSLDCHWINGGILNKDTNFALQQAIYVPLIKFSQGSCSVVSVVLSLYSHSDLT